MALSDITSVFSKYFVVGFFLPAYIALVALWLSASSQLIPNTLESHSQATQLLILGVVALVAALALSAASYYVTRFFEGYPLERVSRWPAAKWAYRAAVALQRRSFDRLTRVREDKREPAAERARAAFRLDRFFPHNPAALLPTRVGNAIRAFERHSNVRWGLDGVTAWPRIEALLSADERELLVDAKINFYVFINAAVGALAVGTCLVVDEALYTPRSGWPSWFLYLIPFVLSYVLYRAAIGPATDWGDGVRSSFDLHRLELYEKLGVRAPISFSDERAMAAEVNQALLYGHPLLRDDLWQGAATSDDQPGGTKSGLFARLATFLTRGG